MPRESRRAKVDEPGAFGFQGIEARVPFQAGSGPDVEVESILSPFLLWHALEKQLWADAGGVNCRRRRVAMRFRQTVGERIPRVESRWGRREFVT